MANTIREIISVLEDWAPGAYQESYDNAGLITGNKEAPCTGVLVSLDCTETIVQEAIDTGCNLVVSHHPIVFSGLKQLTGKNYIERTVIKAIKNDICIYAIHTNLDNVHTGVNRMISDKLALKNGKVLAPKANTLSKLVLYGTPEDIANMQQAVFHSGGGVIGNYGECSFEHPGTGAFKPLEGSNPTLGKHNKREKVAELRTEILVPKHKLGLAIAAAKKASSYEEIAYDLIPLENKNQEVGSGWIGELAEPMEVHDFLLHLKATFGAAGVRFSGNTQKTIKTVALCGGAGFFLLRYAMAAKADVFVTGDVKYHQFFDAEDQILLADIGHYESEKFTIELIANYLKEKFTTFAVRLTSKNTNPVNYL